MKFRSAPVGNMNRNGMASAASRFAAGRTFICNRNLASRSRAISRTSSSRSSRLPAKKFVLDGELVIDVGGRFSFDELQLRLHPAASRVQKLAAAHPATFIVFDLLESDAGKSLLKVPLRQRRIALEKFAAKNLKSAAAVRLSPATTSLAQAKNGSTKPVAISTASLPNVLMPPTPRENAPRW